ncbi:UDP-N-acetylglucosamine--LPS N-acetylglucosamine transferase [Amaricoccus sp.]|uniref:UDP-N-acetylglucosamine--LPS N-acetylglucosamine transferase n=1 Tax=Amaricoccus sp. TaxID=1872485 RepID=UPI001B6B8362|nr:UDP-N-acetylglucosamine--LPS N-acetylglucosamine transferase [Amaricoccus sp.]MBP7003130.1 UDP-N-acetylglucosamine--LPS N-acetylglucosamine transferase [Amaricoccus sp.]
MTDATFIDAAPRRPAPKPKRGGSAPARRRKVLAVSSGGGHWVELGRLRAAFAGLEVIYASTDPSAAAGLDGARHYVVRNVTRRDRWGFAVAIWQLLRILLRERPDVVVTTGAAPGFLALAAGKLLCGSRTIWIDSVASAETLSLSARLARPVADAWLVQWAHLARRDGPEYWGTVL